VKAALAGLRWRSEGEGPCLVLVHGWALSLDYWDMVAPLLTPDMRVLRFDRHGFGKSADAASIAADCRSLLQLLDAAGIGTAHVLGMSQGARVAIAAALHAPERVASMILDGPPAFDAEPELPLGRYRQVLAAAGAAGLREEIRAHPLMQLHTENPRGREVLTRAMADYSGQDLLAPHSFASPTNLGPLNLPTLIINGERDTKERLRTGVMLLDAIPGAARRVIAGAGHLAALDHPGVYAGLVRLFCGSARSD
jgi:pimeloyl-ACP methyl ester carboxylesterase